MEIIGKEIIAAEGKYIHRKGTDAYFKRCILLKDETIENFEEVDNLPDSEVGQARAAKIDELNAYYNAEGSNGVNEFFVNEISLWLDPTLRGNIERQINSNVLLGNPTTNLPINGVVIPIPNDTARMMLAKLELYTGECYNVRDAKEREINALTTKEEVEAYDVTSGYPEKLKFEL